MKTCGGFFLRKICGKNTIISEKPTDLSCVIIMINESAAFLWNKMQGRDFSCVDLISSLCHEYDVSEDVARKDVEAIINDWKNLGLITE